LVKKDEIHQSFKTEITQITHRSIDSNEIKNQSETRKAAKRYKSSFDTSGKPNFPAENRLGPGSPKI
jgi:hypothetical protein